MFFPELCGIIQPLSGEYGGRRAMLEAVPFVCGYGVDVGLLIDLSRRFGFDGIAQVDLDVRHHRNRPLDELSPQATAVAQTILERAHPGLVDQRVDLIRPDREDTAVAFTERPPIASLERGRAPGPKPRGTRASRDDEGVADQAASNIFTT